MSAAPLDPNKSDVEIEKEQGFLTHLFELRDRLLRMVLSIIVLFLCLFPFNGEIYTWLAGPLMAHLPDNNSMIATEVASPFLVPFKMTLMLAVFLSVPVILYQMWSFIAPGLYLKEKRLVRPLLISSTLLFYLGVAFAYYVVFPLIFSFFASVTPEGVAMMTDIGKYLDFIITIFFAFGMAFEVPIATILLVVVGMTTPDKLAEKRPFIIVGAFVLGMFLTPPDVISQTLLALPMWLLFEIGLLFSRLWVKRKAEESEPDPEGSDATAVVGSTVATAVAAGSVSSSEASEDWGLPPRSPDNSQADFEILEYEPLTDEQMESELDQIESDETDEKDGDSEQVPDGIESRKEPESEFDQEAADAEANMEDLEEEYQDQDVNALGNDPDNPPSYEEPKERPPEVKKDSPAKGKD
ncbi:MAG: twin-arginine translocase subunit TatC [Gammaproteobacteria bacterium]|nr:twin-arginine translocase subunit TatC [Gammaproteobacteria bacterium]